MSGSRIAVFGAGYAGLVTGACFAELGHSVTIRDIVPAKIEALNAGELPIFEPGLEELIQRNRERLAFTLDPAAAVEGSQFVFICVDTPPTYAGDADLSRVWTVIEELPPASERMILVMKSTVPVGTGETVRANLDARGFEHVGYVSNPEFLAEGTALKDFLEPDRVVVGAFEDADADAVEQLHAGLDAPVVRTDVASAEMIKLASNAFLGTRISFINEIANVCELVGADVNDVARGMGLDSRIGTRYLKPGIGFGGSCFPKDISFLKLLAGNSGYHFQLLNSVIEVNELQKRRVIGKLQKHLGSLRGRCIALLGLAFKAHTDDLREAPSIVLASRLLAEGADVRAWDPVADASQVLRGVSFASTVDEAVAGADAAVIVTEWDELRTPRLARDARRDANPADHRRAQPARSGRGARRGLRLRGDRPPDLAARHASRDGRAAKFPHPRGRTSVAITREGLEAFAFNARRVEKPWGYELIWAHSEHYCGKLLFIREGEQLSLQFHNREGRDDLRPRGQDRDRARRGCRAADRGGGRRIPHPARDDPPVAGARGRARARGLDARARRRGAVGRPLRPRRHVSSSPIPPTSAESSTGTTRTCARASTCTSASPPPPSHGIAGSSTGSTWRLKRRILEIGCGPAELWAQNLDRIPAGWELTLADLSPGMVEKARERARRPRRLSRGRHPGPSVRGRVVRRRRREPHALPRPRPAAGARGDPTRAPVRRAGSSPPPTAASISRRSRRSTNARRASSSGSRTRATSWREFFVDVELERYPGGLEVTEVEPVLAFLRSMDHGIRDGADEAIAGEIERHGVFRVTTSAGLFRCRKP